MKNKEIIREIERTISMEAKAIESLLTTVDKEKVAEAVALIGNSSGKVVISGCGTSAMAARKGVHSLNCIECPSVFLTPSDAVHGGLGVLQKEDIFILVSKGGGTEELVHMIPACKAKGAALIAITENEESEIGKMADICIKVKINQEPCRFNMLATASTLGVISVFDAICISLMQYTNYTKEQFAIIHPGGAVGDRLLGKVTEE
ncbi:KpsF/GutQ family sugar-phosphate isomerase [Faecalicatena contorta]|uniref:KpsF/GutQ family protein n=1 Tax=Faecalicatena contorta TaxID=39482 RepID=A0A315ZWF6_9FIRM|nr:SIS domain-containing protein [Faecalicatena contorta]PWJ49198.1 KpsF/GutQ family protein [Faecalicatena contorta]SUQ14903.1 KpsF/GutQ family protein [Faecalicatena contorta]